MMLKKLAAIAIVSMAVLAHVDGRPEISPASTRPVPPPVPGDLWIAPQPDEVSTRAALASAVSAFVTGRSLDSLATFERAASDPVLGGYALLYLGRAQLSLGGNKDAFATAKRLRALSPAGYLQEASLVLMADAAAEVGEYDAALAALQHLSEQPGTQSIPTIELKRGRAALGA